MGELVRIQRQRTKGWRMPEGAVYVGRPTIFGNPWTMLDAVGWGVPPDQRQRWMVAQYRKELEHGGLMSDYHAISPKRAEAMCELYWQHGEKDAEGLVSIKGLFRRLLRDATALACWCPLDQPCHADVLIELLA